MVVHNSIELNEMNQNVTNLVISSNSCNELNSLNLNEYKQLKSIEIESNCFENIDVFSIIDLSELKSLKIGKNSFTHVKKGEVDSSKPSDRSRSFFMLNCVKLESIEIGECSFCDYGKFKLINLPSLSSIKIGEIGTVGGDSSNFFTSSFKISGIREIDS